MSLHIHSSQPNFLFASPPLISPILPFHPWHHLHKFLSAPPCPCLFFFTRKGKVWKEKSSCPPLPHSTLPPYLLAPHQREPQTISSHPLPIPCSPIIIPRALEPVDLLAPRIFLSSLWDFGSRYCGSRFFDPTREKKKGRFLMLLRTRFAAVWTQLSSYRIWDGSHGLFSEDLWAIFEIDLFGI